jgi:glycosyltransferase involved in cell wall biosynthesis
VISFIVIGRNEGWKLTKCLVSIFNTINTNHLKEFEVIYIDSKSEDDSIDRAKKFKDVQILVITGDCNPAIARNIGAIEATGDTFFFIDGDMELNPSFLSLIYSPTNGLIHPFVSGNWTNYNYDLKDKLIHKNNYLLITADRYEKVTGGLFLISKKTWEKVSGMRSVFKKSQDIDLGLRLAKENIFLLRKKEISAKHHTIAYLDKNRMWKDLFTFNHLYGRSLLYRKHVFNRQIYSRLLRNDYTLLLLIGVSLFGAFTHSVIIFLLYFLAVLSRGKFKLSRFAYLFIRDVSVLLGLFLFWPKKNLNIIVKIIYNVN